jgi:hypothetical protein
VFFSPPSFFPDAFLTQLVMVVVFAIIWDRQSKPDEHAAQTANKGISIAILICSYIFAHRTKVLQSQTPEAHEIPGGGVGSIPRELFLAVY